MVRPESDPPQAVALKHLLTALRSRRLAVILLVGLTVYAWLATIVPLESVDPTRASHWAAEHPTLAAVTRALGLHHAFSTPLFIAALVLVTLSTGLCAWERSTMAVRRGRALGRVTESRVRTLRQSPHIRLGCMAATKAEAAAAADTALRTLRMRVRRGPLVIEGTSNTVGLLGSPLFHWALVGLFVAAGVGQMTRHEGTVRVLVQTSVQDDADAYESGAVAGPLFRSGYSDSDIGVTHIEQDLTVDGIPRGSSPYVEVVSDAAPVAVGWVYANNPLRAGPIVIHLQEGADPAVVGSVRSLEASSSEQVVLYYDFDVAEAQTFGVDSNGDETLVIVTPVGGERVAVEVAGGSPSGRRVLGAGESVPIADDLVFEVEELTYYVSLRVVNDRSVPWVFCAFGLLVFGSALTVFVPPRVVHVMVVESSALLDESSGESPGAYAVHAYVSCPNSDPAFPRMVEEQLRSALDAHVTDNQQESIL